MNVVDYLVETDTTTTFNDYDKKDNEQMYFQLCESCFWCASCIHLSSEEDITKCQQNCNIQANGRVPITENEFLDMALNTDKDDKIADFHMTYVRTFDGKEDIFFGKKFSHPLKALSIRTDIGPHIGSPHIDIELSDIITKRYLMKRLCRMNNLQAMNRP